MTEPRIEFEHIARPRLPVILAAFFRLGITSFGGNTAAWLYYRIVQRRHWVTDAEFLSGVALGRTMPGSGGVNLTVLVGQRLCGGAGAVAAVTGLLSGPLAIVVALAIGYTRVGWNPVLHAVLDGIAAAAHRCSRIRSISPSLFTGGRRRANSPISSRYRALPPGRERCSRR